MLFKNKNNIITNLNNFDGEEVQRALTQNGKIFWILKNNKVHQLLQFLSCLFFFKNLSDFDNWINIQNKNVMVESGQVKENWKLNYWYWASWQSKKFFDQNSLKIKET